MESGGHFIDGRHTGAMRRNCVMAAAALAWMGVGLPGCIVREMHDDLARTRAGVERLAELTPALEKTNGALEATNAELRSMRADLAAVRASIEPLPGRVDQANEHLRKSDEMLAHLDPMRAALRNLDESLAAMRKIVENIDKMIPLVNITKGTPPADEAVEKARQGAPGAERKP